MNEISFLTEILKGIILGVATWAALKVEIANASIIAKAAKESADEAHKRIDIHLEKGK